MLQPIDVEAQVTADAGRTFMTFYEKATDCEHLQVSFCSKVHGAMQQTSRSSNPFGVYKHIPTQKKRHAGPKFGSITYSQIIKEIINIFIPFDYFFLMLSRAFLFVLLSSTSHFFAAAMAHFPYRVIKVSSYLQTRLQHAVALPQVEELIQVKQIDQSQCYQRKGILLTFFLAQCSLQG